MTRPNPITPTLFFGFVAAVIFGAALPYFVTDFTTFQFTQAMIYGIALLGLSLCGDQQVLVLPLPRLCRLLAG